ncbi:MAG: histidinol dehydrogenase, partial [Ginsengibacter sp.]
MENIFLNPGRDHWPSLIKRPGAGNRDLEKIVEKILLDVQENGDAALSKYSLKFDGNIPGTWAVSGEEIESSADKISHDLKEALSIANENIEKFHTAQVPKKIKKIETAPGVICWRKSVPIENVGLYIPGGTAPLFSTLLMLGIPAMLAGCKNIIVCTPAGRDGKINPAILFVAKILGLKNIYKIGGA